MCIRDSIVKIKNGKTKKRVILDCKQSGVSRKTKRRYKVSLPKITDVVRDILVLLASRCQDEGIELFILDFSDAFWNVPLSPAERKWFAGKVRGYWLVYNCTAQGSQWAVVMVFHCRTTRKAYPRDVRPSHRGQDSTIR